MLGYYFSQDEDIYTFFEPELPSESSSCSRAKTAEIFKASAEKKNSGKPANIKNTMRTSHGRNQKASLSLERKVSSSSSSTSSNNNTNPSLSKSPHDVSSWHEGSSVLDLKGDNYFSCAVGRKRSNARYLLNTSEDVLMLLKNLAESCNQNASVNSDNLFLNSDRMR